MKKRNAAWSSLYNGSTPILQGAPLAEQLNGRMADGVSNNNWKVLFKHIFHFSLEMI